MEQQLSVIVQVMTPVDPGVPAFGLVEFTIDAVRFQHLREVLRTSVGQWIFLADAYPEQLHQLVRLIRGFEELRIALLEAGGRLLAYTGAPNANVGELIEIRR